MLSANIASNIASSAGISELAGSAPQYRFTNSMISPSGPPADVKVSMVAVVVSGPWDIQLGAIPDARLRFKRPLAVRVYREDGVYIAYAPDIEEFGSGDDRWLALRDLGKTIAELFFSLEARKDQLGPDLVRYLEVLRSFLELRRQ